MDDHTGPVDRPGDDHVLARGDFPAEVGLRVGDAHILAVQRHWDYPPVAGWRISEHVDDRLAFGRRLHELGRRVGARRGERCGPATSEAGCYRDQCAGKRGLEAHELSPTI